MDVLRKVRALRRNPEKFVEESLTADCGALHLHHPEWYGKSGGPLSVTNLGDGQVYSKSHVNLVSYEDFHSLSSIHLGKKSTAELSFKISSISLAAIRPLIPPL